ncbi:hypothetical protein E4U41_007267 [Claviceps citrina]|nr:hypothetical protein E4U41_007267 [Claviceps citrina]
MGLVDYSSSSDEETAPAARGLQEPRMPPLPPAFHDLYASTVRKSVVDDASLHQGRKRQNPHVAGHWPTHIYVECMYEFLFFSPCFNAHLVLTGSESGHPTVAQHDALDALVKETQRQIGHDVHLHSFLTSDLGTPLPLHISLSRPLSLPTSIKDEYVSRIQDGIRTSGIGSFSVRPAGLAWHKSPDSNRTFLVLRLVTADRHDHRHDEKDSPPLRSTTNPELMTLLARCNAVAALFGQPSLYQKQVGDAADGAFHISVGWTMASPDEATCLRVVQEFRDAQGGDHIRDWEIVVEGVKAKTGNVISHVPLSSRLKRPPSGQEAASLFSV